MWVKNQSSLRDFADNFTTIGTVEQKASSVSQKLIWNAETKNYDIVQYPEYTQIYPLSVLDFEGAAYIQKPEKRSYYGSYAPEYQLTGSETASPSAFTVVEFSPTEDCVPNESVKIKIKKIIDGDNNLEGSVLLFCNHTNENPEPIYKDRTYIACITFNNWAHGKNVKAEEAGRKPEYNPIEPHSNQYTADGILLEDSQTDLLPYYEVTSDFYETEVGKRYLNLAEGAKRLDKTFPVTGTNSTNLLMPFFDGDAYMVDGNDISKESYAGGDHVCLVSDVFANNNNLKVGDEVQTQFYYTNSKNDAAQNFDLSGGKGIGFTMLDANGTLPSIFEKNRYKIVGIYTVNPGASGIGGDEMIVPINSIEKQGQSNILSFGPMSRQTTSFQIPNGKIEQYMQEWERQGITELDITFYDKGYSSLKSGIDNMKAMSIILSLVGICMGAALLFMINYLFISSQKRKTAIERGLGVSKRKAMVSMLTGIYLLLIIGCSAGGAIGFGIFHNISAIDLTKETYDVTYSK